MGLKDTTIRVQQKTKKMLDSLKITDGETYEGVILRLIREKDVRGIGNDTL